MTKYAVNQSVWRVKGGMQQMSDKLVEYLSQESNDVKLYLNEPVERLDFEADSSVRIKTKSLEQNVDVVISNINAKCKKHET